MTSRIEPGDMVRLVWGCCAEGRRWIGFVSTVRDVLHDVPHYCEYCRYSSVGDLASMEDDLHIPLPWLIKIEPPAKQTDTTDEREVVA